VLPEITAAGATLVAISPQTERLSRETAERRHLSFDILWDKGNEAAARYGLRFRLPDDLIAVYQKIGVDLPKANADESWTLPMPARFVIDRGGIIRAVDVDPDYTRRPEPAQTVETLRRLQA
jgi:peroxiredoxin